MENITKERRIKRDCNGSNVTLSNLKAGKQQNLITWIIRRHIKKGKDKCNGQINGKIILTMAMELDMLVEKDAKGME
jgi:hypothetical protein